MDRGRIELPPKACKAPVLPLSLTARILKLLGESYENRTRDSGITTRGFTTKLTTPLPGAATWNRTTITAFVARHIIHYTIATIEKCLSANLCVGSFPATAYGGLCQDLFHAS